MSYQVCSNCVMDTSDPNISFDDRGWCNYCNNFYKNILPNWHPDERGEKELQKVINIIKAEGKDKEHDCIIGISGGADSSYLTYIAKEKLGLRPLIFHVDAGWNTQESTNNINKLIEGLNLDLYTEVIDWEEMKDLQRAFFLAGVPNLDAPQDHVFFASLYNYAVKHGYKYILTGANYSTECIREPLEWVYHASDLTYLRDIHSRFGKRPLKSFPVADIFKYRVYYRLFYGLKVIKPLNYLPYNREQAMEELSEKLGWQKYGHKHYESRFTRFFEGFWLPKRFGYDKRKTHFSSLILSKQMMREQAVEELAKPPYDEKLMIEDFEYVAKKLDFSTSELWDLFYAPKKSYRDYKNKAYLINFGASLLTIFKINRQVIR